MENTGVKNEFFTNYDSFSFCHGCLCTDRVLSTVTEYVDIYYKICDNPNMDPPNRINLCWECTAMLKKIRMFRKKIAEAQRMLQFYYTNNQVFPHNLSNLVIHTTEKEIKLTHENKDVKAVKQEPKELEDLSDNFDYPDDVKDGNEEPLVEIPKTEKVKDESEIIKIEFEIPKVEVTAKPESSKRNTILTAEKSMQKRKGKYRFINIKFKKHRRLLVKKIPIKLNEVLSGLDMERCDDLFVKQVHKCVPCVAFWSDEDGAVKHCKRWHDQTIGPYQCSICQIHCPSQDKLRTHESKHFYLRECKICQFVGYSRGVMDRHLEQHHRMVQCLACQLCFKNVRLFYDHHKALHNRFVCDVCGRRCKSRDIIEKHLRLHFGYICPYCRKNIKNLGSYKDHIETHQSPVSDRAYCVQCDRRFTNYRMYRRHLLGSSAHAKERDNTRVKKKFPCPECDNVYTRATYMNNHYRLVHSKQSKHYCEDCDRMYLTGFLLRRHIAYTHEKRPKPRNHMCIYCGKGFTGEAHDKCEACLKGKASAVPVPGASSSKTTQPLQLIHSDVCGPLPEASWGGARYLVTFTDDFSRKTFGYLMKNKSQMESTVRGARMSRPLTPLVRLRASRASSL